MNKKKVGGWQEGHIGSFKEKPCVVCNTLFKPRSGISKFCSSKCKGKWPYITGKNSTENQYKQISGNWERYLKRLIYSGGRKRDCLTYDALLKKLKSQNYKCALSGVELTCILDKGNICKTNATIDRINAGGIYSENNIQLVCRAVNGFRVDTSIDEFIHWCGLVYKYNKGDIKDL